MCKLQPKISGCFRTMKRAMIFPEAAVDREHRPQEEMERHRHPGRLAG